MNITQEQTQFLKELFITKVEQEFSKTKKVISTIPENKAEYKPDPKAKTALELAWHIAASEIFFLQGISALQFSSGDQARPAEIKTIAAIVSWYEKNFLSNLEKVKSMNTQALNTPVNFYDLFNLPGVMYLSFMTDHTIHHRGQLSTYFRPMGAKAPSIYGGSADEPFQPGN